MLNARNKRNRSRRLGRPLAARSVPRDKTTNASVQAGAQAGTQSVSNHSPSMPMKTSHVLTNAQENAKLYAYESRVR